MILNGMRVSATQSMAASLGAGVGAGGLGLLVAGSAAMSVLPIAAGAAAGAGILVASTRAVSFLRAALFNRRIKSLEQQAKSLGLNPDVIMVNAKTDQPFFGAQSSHFEKEFPMRLSGLVAENERNVYAAERHGDPGNHFRISREAFNEARQRIAEMALQKNTAAAGGKYYGTVVAEYENQGHLKSLGVEIAGYDARRGRFIVAMDEESLAQVAEFSADYKADVHFRSERENLTHDAMTPDQLKGEVAYGCFQEARTGIRSPAKTIAEARLNNLENSQQRAPAAMQNSGGEYAPQP